MHQRISLAREKQKRSHEYNNFIVFKIIPTLSNSLDETIKWYCMLPSGKVFYNSAVILDINRAITMATIFEVNKNVTNMN